MPEHLGKQIGNYRLIRTLGVGGFADVYLGEHVYLHTQAAIKILQTRLAQNNLATFLTEARTIANLVHPNIVQVLDFGEAENTPFLVMAYASGGTLRQRHPAGTRLSLAEVIAYITQTAEALQYAHERKFIHRDVKPENMLLGPDGKILLSDFGIAVVSQSSRYQGKQEVGGTVAYMAPEQLQGKASAASDQYALGIVAYEWLAGKKPFNGSFIEIASQHLFTPPPPLREKVPELSLAVEQVLSKALNKDPQQRFLNIKDFANALSQSQSNSFMLGGTTSVDQENISTVIKPYANSPYLPAQSSVSNQPSQSAYSTMSSDQSLAQPPISNQPSQSAYSTMSSDQSQTQPSASNNPAQAAKSLSHPAITDPIATLPPTGFQQDLNTPTPNMLALNEPVQQLRERPHKNRKNRGLAIITRVLIILLVAASSAGITYYFTKSTPFNSSDKTINKNLHLTCLNDCALTVILNTIVVKANNSTIETHFSIKNDNDYVCGDMYANPLYLEDASGHQTAGGSPGTLTEKTDLNVEQTFQEYSTFHMASLYNTLYTLHITINCNNYDYGDFQVEQFSV